jgi:hypothetical protein
VLDGEAVAVDLAGEVPPAADVEGEQEHDDHHRRDDDRTPPEP